MSPIKILLQGWRQIFIPGDFLATRFQGVFLSMSTDFLFESMPKSTVNLNEILTTFLQNL